MASHKFDGQTSTNFHVISKYFFDVILLIEKCTLFPRAFFDAISMVEKSMLFPRTFFDVILMEEKSTLSARTIFEEISMGKNLALFLVGCKLMRTFEEAFLH